MRQYWKKTSIFMAVFMIVMTLQGSLSNVFANTTLSFEQKLKDSIMLYIGNPNAIINEAKVSIDHKDPKIKPVIKNNRTLVPVRFIAETLDADVTWNSDTNMVTLGLDSKVVKLTIGSDKILINDEERTIDVAAEIMHGRTYLPLRSVVEAFDKKVFYDRNLIIVSDVEDILDTHADKDVINKIIKWFTNPTDDAIVLHVGSPITFVNGRKSTMDNNDIKIQPIIKNDRTLVPVRFIAESLKVDINWDSVNKRVTLTTDVKRIKLNIGSDKIFVNDKEVIIDVPAQIIHNRTYLPLRAVAEAFDKKVFYDKGLIVIGDRENIINKENEIHVVNDIRKNINNHDKEAFSVIYNSFKALETENLDAYIKTVHKTNEEVDTARDRYTPHFTVQYPKYEMESSVTEKLRELFSVYDLKYEIESLGVMETLDNTIKVVVLRTVKKSNGPHFQDFRAYGVYTLSKINNEWKITRVQESIVEYLVNEAEVSNLQVTNITDTVIHPEKPIIYITDKLSQKLYAFNYETENLSEMSFNLPPESIDFADNEIYVALLKGEHNPDWPENEQKGAIAIINSDTLELKEQFDVDIDPFDTVAGRDGHIYITSGSGQWSYMKSYSIESKKEVAATRIHDQSYALLHPIMDKIFTVTDRIHPKDVTVYNMSNGIFTDPSYPGGIDSKYHGQYGVNGNFKISPDGKYIFSGVGNVFECEQGESGVINYFTKLNQDFSNITFDLENNRFFTNRGYIMYEYNYSNFEDVNFYIAKGDIVELYYKNDEVIAISKNDNKYYINKIQPNN